MKYTIFIILFILAFMAPTAVMAEEKSAGSSATMSMLAPVTADIQGQKRVRVLRQYLTEYNSDLAPHADVIVAEADKYNIDWRLLAAISGVESTFCHELPTNSYNCWGYGIYGNQVRYFTSYDDAISTISQDIREKYLDKWGATDVYSIGRLYAASPTWAQRVTYFIAKIDDLGARTSPNDLSLTL